MDRESTFGCVFRGFTAELPLRYCRGTAELLLSFVDSKGGRDAPVCKFGCVFRVLWTVRVLSVACFAVRDGRM